MNKIIPLLAFSILLLVPFGANNAFAQTCPPDTAPDAAGNCVLQPPCPTGSIFVPPTSCGPMPEELICPAGSNLAGFSGIGAVCGPPVILPDCPVGTSSHPFVQSLCAVQQPCPTGMALSSGPLFSFCIPDPTCPPPFIEASGACTLPPITPASCPAGSAFLGSSSFVFCGFLQPCPDDTLPTGTNECGPLVSLPSCPSPYTIDGLVCITAALVDEVIGGELIPIETTSLLLASAQSFSWMIPVVLSGIGIGLFAVSRKNE